MTVILEEMHVLLLFTFLTAGGAYIVVDLLAPFLVWALAVAVIAIPIYLAITWLSEYTALYEPMIAAWEWLSGWHVGQNIAANPPSDPKAGLGTMLMALLAAVAMVGVAIGIMVVGLTAIIAAPVGVALVAVGVIANVFTLGRRPELLKMGLGILAVALAATIAAGVLMRIIDLLSYIGSTKPMPWAEAAGPVAIGVFVAALVGFGLVRARA